jgi:peptide/nickel transport system substrate-binding protein
MTHTSRRARVLAAFVAMAVTPALAAGCSAGQTTQPSATGSSGSGSSGPAPQGSKNLSVGMVLAPTSLDFTKADGAAIPQALLGNVYEGLVKLDQDGKVVPSLTKSWQVSPDRTTYTFVLNENVKFTNGAPFTADDVKFSVDRTKTDWTTSLAKVMGVVKEVTVVSPTTVQVVLTKPSNDWLFRMAATRLGAMFSRTGVADLAKTPVGTGPYKLESYKQGDTLTLARNQDYWGKAPYFEKVDLKYVADTSALNNAMLSGGLDVLSIVQPDAVARFADANTYQTIEGTTNGEVVLSFNNAKGPFADKLVRQAARAAINHQDLMGRCWGGKGKLIGSMVPPTDPWFEDLTGIAPYDVAKAKSLLGQAKTPNPAIRLRIPTAPYAVSCGQVVKSQLEQAGFTVTMDQMDFPSWLTTVLKNSDYDASIVAHVEPRDLPTVFGNPDYYIHYKNPALNEALAAADAGDEATQIAKMKEAARLISEDAAADWLFLLPNLMVAKKGITGLPQNSVSESFDLTGLSRT